MVSWKNIGYDITYPDRLTSCGGTSVSYNAMGYPTTYDGYTASWTRGKLSRLTRGNRISGTHTYSYNYNALGQRISRGYTYSLPTMDTSAVVAGMLTGYSQTFKYDQSGRLVYEVKTSEYYGEMSSSDSIVYLYDENSIVGMVYTSEIGTTATYYFQRNLFGDVIGIYDISGTKVGGYAYDAWGNCTITLNTSGIATRNPIRYRGYYYDEETQLYWVSSRCYSPEFGRFLQVSDVSELNPHSINGLNLYAYANNNPISYSYNNVSKKIIPTLSSSAMSTNMNVVLIPSTIGGSTNKTSTNPLSFSVGLLTPEKYEMPSWMSVYAFYAKGTLGWGYTFGDGYSLASFSAGVLDATFHTPKWFSSLPDDHWANPNIYLGFGTWNVNASVGAGISGTAEIISGTVGLQFGDAISIGVKGYVGIGFAIDFTNGIKFGVGWGLGYEISLNIDWYKLFH